MRILLFIAAIAAAFCTAGCADEVGAAGEPNGGGAMPLSPKDQLNEERLTEATRGLRFTDAGVTVTVPMAADRPAGERLRILAERVTQERNTWFVSVGAFRDAILADPGNAKSYEGMARALLLEGNTGLALKSLFTALRIDPRFAKALFQLGAVRQMEGDMAGAVAEWRRLAAFEPGYEDVYSRMAIASYYLANFDAAWTYLREADRRHQAVPPQFRPLLQEAAPRP